MSGSHTAGQIPPPSPMSQRITIQILSPSADSDAEQIHPYELPVSVLSRTSSFFAPFLYGYVGTIRISWSDHESWELYQHWLFMGEIVTPLKLYKGQIIGDADQQARISFLGLVGAYCFGKKMGDMRFTDGVMNRLMESIREPDGHPHIIVPMLLPTSPPLPTTMTGTVDGIPGIPPKLHPIITMAYSLTSTGNALHRFFAEIIAWFASPLQISQFASSTVEEWLKVHVMVALANMRGIASVGLAQGSFARDKCMFHDHADLRGHECVAQ